MSSTVRYRAAEEMYRSLPLWNNVPERDRRDLFEDLLVRTLDRFIYCTFTFTAYKSNCKL